MLNEVDWASLKAAYERGSSVGLRPQLPAILAYHEQAEKQIKSLRKEALDALQKMAVSQVQLKQIQFEGEHAEKIREAAQAYLDRVDTVEADSRYQAVWYLYQVHGGDYTNGPKWEVERERLRVALGVK